MEQDASVGKSLAASETDKSSSTGSTGGAGGDHGRSTAEPQGDTESYEEPGVLDGVKAWAGDLFGQASELIARPGEFFAELPREGGMGSATAFAVVMGAVAGILGFVLRVLPPFSAIFTTPFLAFAATVVGAFLIHVLAMLAGGKGALDASYRLAAYLMVFLPLIVVASVLPYLHIAVAGYGLYALIMGVIPLHEIEEQRAWSIFGAVGAIGLLAMLSGSVWL